MIVLTRPDGQITQLISGHSYNLTRDGKLEVPAYVAYRMPLNGAEIYIVPDQPTEKVWDEDTGKPIGNISMLKRYSAEEEKAIIDKATAQAINNEMHPESSIEEQIGILRAQIGAILIELGLDPTGDFTQLNNIANAAIQEAAEKKEALDESSGSIENAAE